MTTAYPLAGGNCFESPAHVVRLARVDRPFLGRSIDASSLFLDCRAYGVGPNRCGLG
jgi:hypothetical protein